MAIHRDPLVALAAYISLLATALFSLAEVAEAVILFRTGDPTANTTEPTDELAGSGWQYEGKFGDFLGTTIAPHFFIAAKHTIIVPDTFLLQGVNYTILGVFDDPESDLRICEVAETLPVYAPLFTGSDEVGHHLVVIGRGTQRGPENIFDGLVRGWDYGLSDLVQRWGENEVASIKQIDSNGDMLYALFDEAGLPNEAHLSGGDSGGAAFLDDGGLWKLAGINYDIDVFYSGSDGGGPFTAALYDARGRFHVDGSLITGDSAVPSGFYASRISARLSWISSIILPRLSNLSARVTVRSGDQVSIAGFIIEGDPAQSKQVMIRGLGPSLQVGAVPIAGRIADPVLDLHDMSGARIASNDNWRSSQATEIEDTGLAPGNDLEAALIANLPAGNYTAVLQGANGSTGTGLIEVYDLDGSDDARLLNLSARAYVGTDDEVLIGGLIVSSVASQVLLRALGPELAASGVTGELADPTLELHDSNGAILAANDHWEDAPNSTDIVATGLAPTDDRESAILTTSGFGTYTVIVRGVGDSTGVALLEAYVVN